MKKIKLKKFLSLFMAAVLLLSIIPLGAITASAATYNNTYTNTGEQRKDIIGVAATQIGYKEGTNNDTKYGDWYGLPNQPWCAMFISWCARQADIPTSVLKNSAVAAPDAGYFNIPYYNGTSYTPKSGDLFFTKSFSHVGLVYYVDGNYFYTIEGNSNDTGSSEGIGVFSIRRKISDYYFGVPSYSGVHTHSYFGSYFEAAHPHRIYQKCSCGKTQYTGKERAYNACSTCMKKSTTHPTPIKAYTRATGKTVVYDSVAGNQKSNKIYDTDVCTIKEIYDCGWCKVTFPLDAGGTETGYVKTSMFFSPTYAIFKVNMGEQVTTYARKDLSASIGYAASGDVVYVVGYTSTAMQIAYPLSNGGHKVGWVPMSIFTYTVKYNANTGSGTMANTSAYYSGKMKLSANTFTKTGHTFAGWNVYRSSDEKWNCSTVGWKTATQISDNGYTKKVYKDGMSSTLNAAWIKGSETNDIFTYYAIWQANTLSVYYNANGGTVESAEHKLTNNLIYRSDGSNFVQTWTYNNKQKNGLVNASTVGLTKTGYTFKGWGTSASGGTIFDQSDVDLLPTDINSKITNGSCTKTLYAIWIPNTYSVKFDANGGESAPSLQTKTYGKTLTISSTIPQREGYTFVGWGTSATDTSASYQPGGSYTSNKSITLYAVWKEIEETHIHDWESDYTVDEEATCIQTGSKSIHCNGCDEKENITIIPMIEHNYETTITKEASCAVEGEQVDRCMECGNEINKSAVSKMEHNYVQLEITDSTCTEEGLLEDVCTECGEHANAVSIPIKEHEFGDWENTKEPTITEDGIDIRRCVNCDEIDTRLVKYESEITTGNCDIDGDGAIGAGDLAEMLKFLLSETILEENEQTLADTNSDGVVDLLDLLRLKLIMAGMV